MCRIICGGVVVKGNPWKWSIGGIGKVSTYWGSLDAMVTAGRRTQWTGSGGKSRGEGDRIDGDGSPGPSGRSSCEFGRSGFCSLLIGWDGWVR